MSSASTFLPFATFFTSNVVLSFSLNVYPAIKIESLSSVTVYSPTGRSSNTAAEPAATVKKIIEH